METQYKIEMGVNKSYGKLWLFEAQGTESEMRAKFEVIKSKGWNDYRLIKVEILEIV